MEILARNEVDRKLTEFFDWNDGVCALDEDTPVEALMQVLEISIEKTAQIAISLYQDFGHGLEVPRLDLYYLYCGVAGSGSKVKIGVTADPVKREKAIRTSLKGSGSKSRFSMTLTGYGLKDSVRAAESKLKKQFSQENIAGEWFKPSDDIQQAVSDALERLYAEYIQLALNVDIYTQIALCYQPSFVIYMSQNKDVEHARNLKSLFNAWFSLMTTLLERREGRSVSALGADA